MDLQTILNELVLGSCLAIKKATMSDDYYIPYMMNDAVECFIRLDNCTLTGNWSNINTNSVSMGSEMNEDWTIKNAFIGAEYIYEQVSGDAEKHGIVFTYEDESVCSIWFKSYEIKCELYNYARLGHFWRPGYDSIRRLVYLIGTIYDKYKYLGRGSCNEMEMEIMTLLGVAPLRAFSPIDDDFAVFYDYDELKELEISGIGLLLEIAKSNGADSLISTMKEYEEVLLEYNVKGTSDIDRKRIKENKSIIKRIAYNLLIGKDVEKCVSKLSKLLSDPENYRVIMEIENRVINCAKEYKFRDCDYKNVVLETINEKRLAVDNYIKGLGFTGEFPEYINHDFSEFSEYDTCTVYEQQSFVIEELEYESVGFKTFLVFRNVKKGKELVKML